MFGTEDSEDVFFGTMMVPIMSTPQPTPVTLIYHPASILSIAIGIYLLVIIIFTIIQQCLTKRGVCSECNICGSKPDNSCIKCCLAISEKCTCSVPSVEKCLDACCPQRKQMDCVDIILCQCCAGAGSGNTCGFGNCKCDCSCDPGCNEINCLCFQLNFVGDNTALISNNQPNRVQY
ncbi:uncharacterized protein LOC106878842 isoform X1 [Octopus bimaculoides]|uniref:Uncharacterized protein n=2 Tax=Octopus bimaculoides TaxID=37653 RepID=A0A0L8G6W0_OCTBM|nr:uncharacterized protein LOC106878842 isoform X1 [Octopus bimaculoides]|eukprot:XP_014783669.1 PREDICTED: uncharacterized protein LOC106878842 isoform X1 [Octopus bimaculoides]